MGDDLLIVSLRMSTADRRERVLARYGGDSAAADLMDVSENQSKPEVTIIIFCQRFETMMEGVGEDEPNTIEVEVTNSMTREQVVQIIRERLREIQ